MKTEELTKMGKSVVNHIGIGTSERQQVIDKKSDTRRQETGTREQFSMEKKFIPRGPPTPNP